MSYAPKLLKALADETRLRAMNLLLVSEVPLPNGTYNPEERELVNVQKRGIWAYQHERGFLDTFLAGERYVQDGKQLEKRLRLRKDGMCVVGFPLEGDPPGRLLQGGVDKQCLFATV